MQEIILVLYQAKGKLNVMKLLAFFEKNKGLGDEFGAIVDSETKYFKLAAKLILNDPSLKYKLHADGID